MNCLLDAEVSLPSRLGDCLGNRQLAGLLDSLASLPVAGRERRGSSRFPFPKLIHITPLGPDARPIEAETMVVVGKSLSPEGIGFFHPHPFPYRRAVVSLPVAAEEWIGVVTEVRWCRFTRFSWYESGARFLDVVEVPLSSDCT